MALPLTTQQQADYDLIGSVFAAFRLALLAATRADNDPNHPLGDARVKAEELRVQRQRLATMLPYAISGGSFSEPDTGVSILSREPAARGFVSVNDTPSTS